MILWRTFFKNFSVTVFVLSLGRTLPFFLASILSLIKCRINTMYAQPKINRIRRLFALCMSKAPSKSHTVPLIIWISMCCISNITSVFFYNVANIHIHVQHYTYRDDNNYGVLCVTNWHLCSIDHCTMSESPWWPSQMLHVYHICWTFRSMYVHYFQLNVYMLDARHISQATIKWNS